MDPVEKVHNSARRLIVAQINDDVVAVLWCKRLRTSDLIGLGFFESIGADAVARVRAEEVTRIEREGRLAACTTPDQRTALEVEFADADRAENDRDLAGLTEDKAWAVFRRSEAIIIASVEAIGFPKEGVELGILPSGTDPASVCLDLAGAGSPTPCYLRSCRIVADAPPGPGIIPISEIPDTSVLLLGALIQIIMRPAREVTSFRDRSGGGVATGSGV